MAFERIPERELSDSDKEQRDILLADFSRQAQVITHHVCLAERYGGPRKEFVAVMKQHRDVRRLIMCGCPLGAPPAHEGGASFLGDYEEVLATLDSKNWTDADKRAIRAFIASEDAARDDATKPSRRRGKHKRR